jgi:hypothetical protein
MRLAASRAPLCGTALGAAYQWATVYPQENITRIKLPMVLTSMARLTLMTGPVAVASRARGNAYVVEDPETVQLQDAGTVFVRRWEDLAAVPQAPAAMTTTAAASLTSQLETAGAAKLQLVAVGIAK